MAAPQSTPATLDQSVAHAAARYYDEVAAAFDGFAPDYEAVHAANPVMAWFRTESLALLQATFPAGCDLLELGCGTGYEARALACSGRQVLATDVSPQMVTVAADLAAQEERGGSPQFRVLAAHQAGTLLAEHGLGSFDGAYSSFGGLNCEPRLPELAAALHQLLVPGGLVVVSVMNRCCPWEIAWYLLHGQPRLALRRFRPDWSPAQLRGETNVPVRYFSPASLQTAFEPYFMPRKMRALGLLAPPPYAASVAQRYPRLFGAAQRLERALRDRWPFPWLGDHLMAVFQRREL